MMMVIGIRVVVAIGSMVPILVCVTVPIAIAVMCLGLDDTGDKEGSE